MILYDGIGHMVSTESAEELHDFARRIGLKREWYQNPAKGDKRQKTIHPEYGCHYDLTTFRMRDKARRAGAQFVTNRELQRRAWWAKKPQKEKP